MATNHFENLPDEDLEGLAHPPRQPTRAQAENADETKVLAEEELKRRAKRRGGS